MTQQRIIQYSAAIREAIDLSMAKDKKVFIIGEGVPDPKGIFGSTSGLRKKYGKGRVMDMPVSENGMTGVCIGAALWGMRPIMTHQRVDFCVLSLDQLINNAAKWYFMFGGQLSVPMVVRIIIGRGWGQGAQHSQSLQAVFAHVPGLKVIMPATPYDAKGLLISAIEDSNPVISIEHRWLYSLKGVVPEGIYRIPLGKAHITKEGRDITIVASSHMTIEALKASRILEKHGIDAEIIDLRTVSPIDTETILASVRKTGHLLVADSGWMTCGLSAEIIARVTEKAFGSLKQAPVRIALPDIPTPSSAALTKNFYPGCREIIKTAGKMLEETKGILRQLEREDTIETRPHDVPDLSFKGPF